MTYLLADARRFFSENDWRTILARMNARDTHPMIQFMKYGICGVGALIVHQTIWTACSTWLFPAIDRAIPKDTRALHFAYNNGIAVIFSTLFAYFTNVLWVFEQGRHHWVKELVYFFLVSLLGFVIGMEAGRELIRLFDVHSVIAQAVNVVISVLVNFLCRKFFVFKG